MKYFIYLFSLLFLFSCNQSNKMKIKIFDESNFKTKLEGKLIGNSQVAMGFLLRH